MLMLDANAKQIKTTQGIADMKWHAETGTSQTPRTHTRTDTRAHTLPQPIATHGLVELLACAGRPERCEVLVRLGSSRVFDRLNNSQSVREPWSAELEKQAKCLMHRKATMFGLTYMRQQNRMNPVSSKPRSTTNFMDTNTPLTCSQNRVLV